MEVAFEAPSKWLCLFKCSIACLFSSKRYLKMHLDGGNYFSVENIQVTAEGKLVNCFLQLEQYVFCVTITDSQSLAI